MQLLLLQMGQKSATIMKKQPVLYLRYISLILAQLNKHYFQASKWKTQTSNVS